MQCAQCQEREATVHFTLVAWCSAEIATQSLCESCYARSAAERTAAYSSQPNIPLPADVEHITVAEYCEASATASANTADVPAFKHIHEELKRFPATRQRLVFEVLPLVWKSLEDGIEPVTETCVATWWPSIEPQRLAEYTMLLEKIIRRCFELRDQVPDPQAESVRFAITLMTMLISLAKADRTRFNEVLASLKSQCGDANSDERMKLLNGVEKAISRSEEKES